MTPRKPTPPTWRNPSPRMVRERWMERRGGRGRKWVEERKRNEGRGKGMREGVKMEGRRRGGMGLMERCYKYYAFIYLVSISL